MPSREAAERLDASDPLAPVRGRFLLPDGTVYLDGNSLGALSDRVQERLRRAVTEQWGQHLVNAWFDDGWLAAPLRVGDRIGRLIGAAPGQTLVGDSASVHLFNVLAAAARLRPGRRLVLVDAEGFPTDRYLAASVARLLGMEAREVPMPELPDAIRRYGTDIAVITAGAVDFRTGELWDVPGLTAAAHGVGALVVWDVCHAAGAVPLALDADGVDFAVGCSYKFLSGGPGAPGFVYAAARHHAALDQPLTGWHGHARPFEMAREYQPADGIARLRIGSPGMLSLLAIDAALDVFDDVDMAQVRAKSLSLGGFFIACADEHLAGLGFEVVTPREPERRGSQVTLRHSDAEQLMEGLVKRGVIGDVRPPELLRFGFNALYVSHTDVFDAVAALRSLA
jgi:kynureninase